MRRQRDKEPPLLVSDIRSMSNETRSMTKEFVMIEFARVSLIMCRRVRSCHGADEVAICESRQRRSPCIQRCNPRILYERDIHEGPPVWWKLDQR